MILYILKWYISKTSAGLAIKIVWKLTAWYCVQNFNHFLSSWHLYQANTAESSAIQVLTSDQTLALLLLVLFSFFDCEAILARLGAQTWLLLCCCTPASWQFRYAVVPIIGIFTLHVSKVFYLKKKKNLCGKTQNTSLEKMLLLVKYKKIVHFICW